MLQREPSQASLPYLPSRGERLKGVPSDRWQDGKDRVVEKVLLEGLEFFGFAVDIDFFEGGCCDEIQKVGQPHHMIQVGVGQQDGEFRGTDQVLQPEHAGTCIEKEVCFAEKERRRMPNCVGMITSGT